MKNSWAILWGMKVYKMVRTYPHSFNGREFQNPLKSIFWLDGNFLVLYSIQLMISIVVFVCYVFYQQVNGQCAVSLIFNPFLNIRTVHGLILVSETVQYYNNLYFVVLIFFLYVVLSLQAVDSLRTIAAEHSSQDLENHFVPLVKRLSQGLCEF